MAQTKKEILRDQVLAKMQPYMDSMTMEVLNQVLVQAMFGVDVIDEETGLATLDNTNEQIIELFMLKKAPKLSQETIRYYLSSIRNLITFTNKSLLKITDMDIECYLQFYKAKGNANSTVNNERRNLSSFYTWLRRCHLVTENPVESIEKFQEDDKLIEYLSDEEMERLRNACIGRNREASTRDRALIEFLRSTAVRVSECVRVNVSDIDWEKGEVVIYGQKNRAYRVACLDGVAKFYLRQYIESRTDNNVALFVGTKGSKERVKKTGIEAIIRRTAEKAGIERAVYPHIFRRTTATNMVRRGCPREIVAFYLGHRNGNTKTLNKHYASTDQQQIMQAFRIYGAA